MPGGLGSTFKPEEENIMEMIAVESRQIKAIGHDPETGKAVVEFMPNRQGVSSVYEYDNVPASVVADIINADSPGRQFGATLKYGFQYRKL